MVPDKLFPTASVTYDLNSTGVELTSVALQVASPPTSVSSLKTSDAPSRIRRGILSIEELPFGRGQTRLSDASRTSITEALRACIEKAALSPVML